MIFRHQYAHGVWVDLEKPTEEDIRQLAEEFSLPERLERELLSPTPMPTMAVVDQTALLVLHIPAQGAVDGETKSQEIDFIVGKKSIITVRYEMIAPLHHLKKLLEAQELVEGKAPLTTEVLLEILFAHLYTSMHDHTNHIAEQLAHVEREMFSGHENTTVRAISNISRQFLHVEAALANQEESLEHFLDALGGSGFFGTSFTARGTRILEERSHVARVVKTHRAIATDMRETNISILSARQNEIMKTLTVINFILLPLGLISWIFAMRTEGMPLINSPYAFWIVLGMMLIVALLMTIFFIRKRWF